MIMLWHIITFLKSSQLLWGQTEKSEREYECNDKIDGYYYIIGRGLVTGGGRGLATILTAIVATGSALKM